MPESEGRRRTHYTSAGSKYNAPKETKRQLCICLPRPRKLFRRSFCELNGSSCCVPRCIACTQLLHRVQTFGQVAWKLWASGEYLRLHAKHAGLTRYIETAMVITHIRAACYLAFTLSDQPYLGQVRRGRQKTFKAACKYANC